MTTQSWRSALEPLLAEPWDAVPRLDAVFTPEYLETDATRVVRGTSGNTSAMSEIMPGYFLGPEEAMSNRAVMQQFGVRLIINMCADPRQAVFTEFVPHTKEHRAVDDKGHGGREAEEIFIERLREACCAPPTMPNDADQNPLLVLNIAADDCASYDISQHLHLTCLLQEIVFTYRDAMQRYWDATGPSDRPCPAFPAVAVHCMAGVSRSATVVCSYIMKKFRATRDDVITCVRARRPIIGPNNGFMNALLLFEHCGYTRLASTSAIPHVVAHLMKASPLDRAGFLRSFVSVVLSYTVNTDRKLFGPLVRELLSVHQRDVDVETGLEEMASPLTASSAAKKRQRIPTTAADIASVLSLTIMDAIQNQDYIDSPKLFQWWCELCHSIAASSPVVMYTAALDAELTHLSPDGAIGAAWSDAVHTTALTTMLEDESNDSPLHPLLNFLTMICIEYHRRDAAHTLKPAPSVLLATGDVEANPQAAIHIISRPSFETFRLSFAHAHFVVLAALREVALHNASEEIHRGRVTAGDVGAPGQDEAPSVRAQAAAEVVAALRHTVVCEDVELFILLAFLSGHEAAAAAPMLVASEWSRALADVSADRQKGKRSSGDGEDDDESVGELAAALVADLVCSTTIRKLASALACAAVLADTPRALEDVKAGFATLRRGVEESRPDDVAIVTESVDAVFTFLSDNNAPLGDLDDRADVVQQQWMSSE